MEMITISGMNNITTDKEPYIDDDSLILFPNKLNENRPFIFQDKSTIFLTCRVHCGETPGSYIL